MSIVGGSMVTTAGLQKLIEGGEGIVPTYFKFSSQDISLHADLTTDDFDGWIQDDITKYNKIDEKTVEFICDVLPPYATQEAKLCGMFTPDGTLFMVAKPPHDIPANLRQTFRIQLVYENADDIANFTYLDLGDQDIKFQQLRSEIDDREIIINQSITEVQANLDNEISSTNIDISNLEDADAALSDRIDILEYFSTNSSGAYLTDQATQDNRLNIIENNRITDLNTITNYISNNNDRSDNIEASIINHRNELDSVDVALREDIDSLILNSDVGNITTQLNQLQTDLTTIKNTFGTNISNLDTQVNTDLTSLTATVNTNKSISDTTEANLNTRVTTLENNIDSLDTEALQTQLNNLETTVDNNSASTNTVTNSLDTRITSLENQDIETLEGKVTNLETNITNNFNILTDNLTNLENTLNIEQDTQDTKIANLESWQNNDYITKQTAQDQALIDSNNAQTLINNGFSSDINIIQSQIEGAPDGATLAEMQVQLETIADMDIVPMADKLTTARTISLTGDVTGSVSFDGSGNVSLATSLSNEGVGNTLNSDLNFNNDGTGISWDTNSAGIKFFNNTNNNGLEFYAGTECFRWTGLSDTGTFYEKMTLKGVDLSVTGTVASQGFATQSARKYKDQIQELTNSLEIVKQLTGVSYIWNKEGIEGKKDIGFIADDVYEVLPELVELKDGEIEGLSYSKITAVLVNAIKEQQLQIEELKLKL